MAERSSSGPSDYLAAERTFLAWIRTGLALMGFGFVVARFGLFLQALRMGQPNGLGQPNGPNFPAQAYGTSFWLGTALIAVGVVVNLVSARNHVRLVRELNRGGTGYAAAVVAGDCRGRDAGGDGTGDGDLPGCGAIAQRVRHRKPRGESDERACRERDCHPGEPSFRGGDDCEAGSDARGQGSEGVRRDRPQRRGGKGGAGDAADQGADLRQPEGGNSADGGRAEHRDRSAVEDTGLGGRRGQGLGSPTTRRRICRHGTGCRRSWCRISRWWRRWRRRRRSEGEVSRCRAGARAKSTAPPNQKKVERGTLMVCSDAERLLPPSTHICSLRQIWGTEISTLKP